MQTYRQQADTPAADAKKCIKRIRSRLERWELTHLRELAASLHEQLEQTRQQLAYAEQCAIDADRRADMFLDMQNEMDAELRLCGKVRGITQDGQLLLPVRAICDDFGNLVQVAA